MNLCRGFYAPWLNGWPGVKPKWNEGEPMPIQQQQRAIIYARVSTTDQADHGYSLPTQVAESLEYAKRNNLNVVETFQEDESGLILDRPQLTQVRDYLRRGLADALICHKDDRLTRVPTHSVILRDEFELLGIQLHYARYGQVSWDTAGQIKEDINARIAKEEIDKFVERSRRGKRGKVTEGKIIVAQRPPFGYDLVDSALVINEVEAEVIRLIFRLYTIERWSIKRITRYLTEHHVLTSADKNGYYKEVGSGVWATSIVRKILSRETYVGVWYWGKSKRKTVIVNGKPIKRYTEAPRDTWIAVSVPAIIDRATFDRAQAILKENVKMSARNTKGEYLMAKRLICGNCGLPIYAETTRDYRNGSTYHYYHCACKSVHNPAPNCGLPYFPANEVDDTVWAWIKALLSDPDFMLELLNKNLEATKAAQSGAAVELDKTNADIKKQEIGLERLYTQLAADEIEQRALDRAKATIRTRLDNLLAKKAELEDGIVELPSRDEITRLTRSIAVYQNTLTLDNEPFEIKSNFVKELNLRGVLDGTRKDKSITVNCYLGEFCLLIGTPPPTRWACKLEIRQTLELPIRIK